MIMIKKYSRLEEGPPKIVKTMTRDQLVESIDKDIRTYKSRMPKRKNGTYRKLNMKIMFLEAYKQNLQSADTIEKLSHIMATSVRGRYRIEDPNGNILRIVYEGEGDIFWDFEDTEEGEDGKNSGTIVPELSAWERLKTQLDGMNLDDESFE